MNLQQLYNSLRL